MASDFHRLQLAKDLYLRLCKQAHKQDTSVQHLLFDVVELLEAIDATQRIAVSWPRKTGAPIEVVVHVADPVFSGVIEIVGDDGRPLTFTGESEDDARAEEGV